MDYEAVPYEAAKALRALASLAYSEPVEVVGKLSRGFPELFAVLPLFNELP